MVKVAVGVRVRELRHGLGLTQKQLAERAGLPDDSYIARVETGANKLTSYAMRVAFARGFGLCAEDLDEYLRSEITVSQAIQRAKRQRTGTEG